MQAVGIGTLLDPEGKRQRLVLREQQFNTVGLRTGGQLLGQGPHHPHCGRVHGRVRYPDGWLRNCKAKPKYDYNNKFIKTEV